MSQETIQFLIGALMIFGIALLIVGGVIVGGVIVSQWMDKDR